MKKGIVACISILLCHNITAQGVENKAISKGYSISSAVANSYVLDTKFDIPINEAGNYLVILEADAVVPYANPNNCLLSGYWNNGHVMVFNKATGNALGGAAGEYTWIMYATGNNCMGGYTIARNPSRSYIVYLQAGHNLGVKASSSKVGTLALSNWRYSGKVIAVRLN